MRRFTMPLLCLGFSLAACGADESFDPGPWGGGGKGEELSGALPNCGEASTYAGEFGDSGETYATAARSEASYVDDRVALNNSGSDQDSIGRLGDVDYWAIQMTDMPTQQFSGDLIRPWVHASVASSNAPYGYRSADPSLEVEVCIYYKWNSGFAGNGGCFGGQEQTVDGVTACCAVVASNPGTQALLELPNVARSVMPDSGELVIRARAADGSDGCGVYHVTWGTRVDSSAYLTKKNYL